MATARGCVVVSQYSEHWFDTAYTLHAYIGERALREGVAYALDADYFLAWLWQGYRLFFGVLVSEDGALVEDQQEPAPGYFKEWLRRRAQP